MAPCHPPVSDPIIDGLNDQITITDHLHETLQDFTRVLEGESSDQLATTKSRLRRDFGAETTRWLREIAGLQKKARSKLGEGVWWVTERSLAQCTAWQVARWKADVLAKAGAFSDSGVDACCGLGGDTVALARASQETTGQTFTAIDRDPMMIRFAERNCRTASVRMPRFVTGDVPQQIDRHADWLHADPDRRSGGRRHTNVNYYTPRLEELIANTRQRSSTLIKLAAAAHLDDTTLTRFGDQPKHRCWISLAGEVREQTLMLGKVVAIGGLPASERSAVMIDHDGSWKRFTPPAEAFSTTGDSPSRFGTEIDRKWKPTPGDWIASPNAAIRAAGLTEAWAATHGLMMPGGPSGYGFFSDNEVPASLWDTARAERIEWVGSADDRKLRKMFRCNGWFPEVIRVRGTGHDPQTLARAYHRCGESPVSLWLGRGPRNVFAVITRSSSLGP